MFCGMSKIRERRRVGKKVPFLSFCSIIVVLMYHVFFIFKIVNERGRTDIPNSWGHGTFVCVLNLEEFGSDEQSSRRRILCKRRGGWLVTGSRLWCRAEDLDGIPPSQPHSSIHFFLVFYFFCFCFFISIERRETETKKNWKKNWTEAIFLPFFLRLHSQLAKREPQAFKIVNQIAVV